MLQTLSVPIVLALLFVVFIRLVENRLVFFPSRFPDGIWQTEQLAVRPHEVFFETEDHVKLHGWHFKQDDAQATLLFLHGNAGNISHRLHFITHLMENLPVDVFIFDYRGYGKSEGSPSEEGVYRDARAAHKYLTESTPLAPEQIILHGRSLGGAVAIDLALEVTAAGLLLESTFSSGNDMARDMFKILPVWWFTTIKFDSQAKISAVGMPVLMLHGTDDGVVPFRLGKKLFEAAREPKKFVAIQGADHNDAYLIDARAFFGAIRDFFEQLQRASP